MSLLILLTTFFFIVISFLNTHAASSSNPLLAFAQIQSYFFIRNLFLIFLAFLVSMLIYIFTSKFKEDYSLFKKILSAIIRISQIVFLSFLLSFIALFVLAVVQLNSTSILVNINPKILGIKSDSNVIIESLKKINSAPRIVISDDNRKIVAAVAQSSTGIETFYGKYIIPSIPSALIIPANTGNSMLLIDKTLIISKIDDRKLEEISPIIGYLFVKDYFGNKLVRSYPRILIMNNNDYQNYRLVVNVNKIIEIDKQLENIAGYISSVSAAIENDRQQIANLNNLITGNENGSQYQKCLENYSEDYCQQVTNQVNQSSKTELNKNLKEWEKQLDVDQQLLEAYQYYDDLYRKQKVVLANSKNIVSNERGIYEPKDNTIKIRLETNDTHSLGDFFAIVVHEYFHYASYQKGKFFKNSFFEEGLTEFFSRQVIKYNLEFSPNLGYPIQSKIMAQMSKRIAENELINIYFSKEDSKFEEALNRVYGDGFYKTNRNAFEALQYSLPPNILIKVANDLMNQIGGEKLNEKDYSSTESEI